MASTLHLDLSSGARIEGRPTSRAWSVPWYAWCSVAAVTSVMIGGYWDISWHMSIGRDTFWTPAHMLIYFSGLLGGGAAGYLILASTFNWPGGLTDACVRMWGFRGPLGAFISAWGGVLMLTSAPFDNWWHNAYGLDVKIFSPPHVALDCGILAVQIGAMVLVAGARNRSESKPREHLEWILLYLGSMILALGAVVIWEDTYRVFLHSARAYRAIAAVVPALLIGTSWALRWRWATTATAATYSVYAILMMWILPLFPAQPKLGPVYQPVTHFVPMEFPLLIIVPAIALDLLRPHWAGLSQSLRAVVAGTVFLGLLLAAEWPFADFLMSPASRNWVFGTNYFAYFMPITSYGVRHLFFPVEHTTAQFWQGIALALGIGVLSARLGIAWGSWLQRVQR